MRTFFEKYKYVLIILFFLIIMTISYFNYKNTEQIIRDKYVQRCQLVENNIIKSFNHVNDAYSIAEQQLNSKMEEYSYQLRSYYEENPDIYSWDFERFKQDFLGYDIYIIDNNLEIVRSTFKKDIGFDFKQFPGFSRVIKSRLEGDSFVVDRLDVETNTGEIKKYSYLPTPDNKYLIELSADIKEIFPRLADVNIFSEAEELAGKYGIVSEIAFYKYSPETNNAGKLRTTADPVNTDISLREKMLVEKAFKTKEMQRPEEDYDFIYSSTFIPALVEENSKENWWNSFVVGINYNTDIVAGEIIRHRNLFITNALIMLGVFIVFIVVVISLLNKFEYMAYHDQLTGLPNRKSFEKRTEEIIKTKDNNIMAIMFIDINNFKEINDKFGHAVGDRILTRTAEKIQESLREGDFISRLGGDEFTVAILDVGSRKEVKKIANRIIALFDEPLEIDNSRFFISVSVGISIYPEDSEQLEELIKKADHAMYKAKQVQIDFHLYNGRA